MHDLLCPGQINMPADIDDLLKKLYIEAKLSCPLQFFLLVKWTVVEWYFGELQEVFWFGLSWEVHQRIQKGQKVIYTTRRNVALRSSLVNRHDFNLQHLSRPRGMALPSLHASLLVSLEITLSAHVQASAAPATLVMTLKASENMTV